jgi:tRNA(Ile)-lysidine synthase
MLHILSLLAGELALDLHVAHVQHGLRGAAAAADADFVQAQAAALHLPCTVLAVDVLGARTARESLEAAARRVRYAALRALAASLGATAIATGHTLDDQAETLLLHLLRGAGLDGLAGMRPRRHDLARPLLAVTHAETTAYCHALGLQARDDLTNHDTRFRRNAVRHDLLPRLRPYNNRIAETLARAAALLADDADYLWQAAEARLAALRVPAPPHALAFQVSGYRALPAALRRRVVRQAVAEVAGTIDGLRAEHVESIDALLVRGQAGRRWQLPRQVRVEVAGELAIVTRAEAPMAPPPGLPVALPVPGACSFGPWQITAQCGPRQQALPAAPDPVSIGHRACCDRRAIHGALSVRSRLAGDRLRPLGLHGSRKLQDLLVDRKVPREQRQAVPVVCDEQGIIWVAGFALDERVAVHRGTTEVVILIASSGPAATAEASAPGDVQTDPLARALGGA